MKKTFHLACVVVALVAAASSSFSGNLPAAACFIGLAVLSKLYALEEA